MCFHRHACVNGQPVAIPFLVTGALAHSFAQLCSCEATRVLRIYGAVLLVNTLHVKVRTVPHRSQSDRSSVYSLNSA